MLDLPPELIDQILYYLTNPETKVCLEASPIFCVLTIRREKEVLLKGTTLYSAYVLSGIDGRYGGEVTILGVFMDYRDAIKHLTLEIMDGTCTFDEDNLSDTIRYLNHMSLQKRDSFWRYLNQTSQDDMTLDSIADELLKLVDMSSLETAERCLQRLCDTGWLSDSCYQESWSYGIEIVRIQ